MDGGLLVALLALQKEFLTHQQFLTAFKAWLVNPLLKLDEILVQRAFLTKNQFERLSSTIKTIQEISPFEWKKVILKNQSVAVIYNDMIGLAERSPTVLQMVKLIGESTDCNSSSVVDSPTMVMRFESHSTTEPIEDASDPYATLSATQNEELEQ